MKDLFINEQFIAEESSWLLIMGAEKYRFARVIWLGFNIIMCGVSCDCFKSVVGVFFGHNQWMTEYQSWVCVLSSSLKERIKGSLTVKQKSKGVGGVLMFCVILTAL